MEWSVYQQGVFNFVENETGNAIVEAVAGSGKTTTIVEAIKRVLGTSIFLAFNKSIATELKNRGVNARTFHSLTYGAVLRHVGANEVKQNKTIDICKRKMTGDDFRLYGGFVSKLVSLGKGVGIGCLMRDTEQNWLDLCIHHDLEPEHEDADLGRAVELASKVLNYGNTIREVDFDDMLYIAVKDGISLPKFDFVFVDEAQDTNPIQRALLRKILHSNSRLIAVGDPAQAIYGFRGADSDSMNRIAEEFDCVTLPLTVSYRCPVAVVNYAHRWVSHIESAPNAKGGEVHDLATGWELDTFEANDLVVCRKTAPLLTLAYSFLKARKPVQVMGREIGEGLKRLVTRMDADNLDQLEELLRNYMERECEKERAKGNDAKVEAIQDRVGALLVLARELPETDRTIERLMQVISELFENRRNAVILATIHKAKGLEADRVFWLGQTQHAAKWVRQDWQKQQEDNLCYVAATRALSALYLIDSKE